jgi:hypothetical protein
VSFSGHFSLHCGHCADTNRGARKRRGFAIGLAIAGSGFGISDRGIAGHWVRCGSPDARQSRRQVPASCLSSPCPQCGDCRLPAPRCQIFIKSLFDPAEQLQRLCTRVPRLNKTACRAVIAAIAPRAQIYRRPISGQVRGRDRRISRAGDPSRRRDPDGDRARRSVREQLAHHDARSIGTAFACAVGYLVVSDIECRYGWRWRAPQNPFLGNRKSSRRQAGAITPRPRREPFVDFLFTPSNAAVTESNRLWELASFYLPSQVVTTIVDTLFRFKSAERDEPHSNSLKTTEARLWRQTDSRRRPYCRLRSYNRGTNRGVLPGALDGKIQCKRRLFYQLGRDRSSPCGLLEQLPERWLRWDWDLLINALGAGLNESI